LKTKVFLALIPLVLVITILLGTATVQKADAAQADYFLKIEGIDGESKDPAHAGQIDILSWSWGVSQTSASGMGSAGAGTGKVSFSDFHITKTIDKSSPKLADALASGQHIPTVELTVRKAGDKPLEYIKITMTDCIISSYSAVGGGSGAGDLPMESISFNFGKIEFNYVPQNTDGTAGDTIHMGWDLASNKKV
jgi:type VI secretion system secreted protein Hcp